MTTLSWTTLFTNQDVTQTVFITNLRTRIDEDLEDLLTDTQIIAHIPTALNEIANEINLFPEFMQATYAGEEYYTLPSNIGKLGAIYIKNGEGDPIFLPKTSMSGAKQFGYLRRGNRLYIYGVPSGAIITVNAIRLPLTPANNGTYIDLPFDFMSCLYLNLELLYWRRRRSAEDIQNAYTLYKEALQKAADTIFDDYSESVSLYGKNT